MTQDINVHAIEPLVTNEFIEFKIKYTRFNVLPEKYTILVVMITMSLFPRGFKNERGREQIQR